MSVAEYDLACYLPAYVRRRIERDPSDATQFWCDSVSSAVMFADISGFTPLANRLAEFGPQGAELLARLLNAFYGRLVDTIYDHGGDVIAYAGDAAIAIWPDTDLKTAVLQAANCGLEIQRHLQDYTVSVEEWRAAPQVKLSVKVAIAGGEMCVANVGGVNDSWQAVLLGPPLAEIAEVDSQLQPGTVVLSSSASLLAGDSVEVGLSTSGSRLVRAIKAPVKTRPIELPRSQRHVQNVARAYVSSKVLAHVELGDSSWLADLRTGSVVFVKLRGIDVAEASAAERLHEVTQTLQRELLRYEGTLIHVIQDDKGLLAVCCFGLPPMIHEDDAARAVAAAMAIQRELAPLEVAAQIGIASGRVFSGLRGNERRCEYSITGQVANLAARLMSNAGDGILCDESTRSAAAGRVTFESLPLMQLKGFESGVPVCRPINISRRSVKQPRRVAGRAREIDTLVSLLEAAARRQKQLFVLEGEAGVGKSTLLHEFCRQAAQRDINVLVGAADAVETSTPYFAWRPIVSRLLRLDEARPTPDRQQRVLAELAFDPTLVERAALLNGVLNLSLTESHLVSQLAGRTRADNLHELIIRLLNRYAEREPLVVAVEDTHWLDSASWRLTVAAAQHCLELTLLISTRPFLVDETHEYSRLRQQKNVGRIYVDVLHREDALELVRERLQVPAVSERLGDFVFERTQGNPFFIEELVNYLLHSSLLESGSGCCDLAATVTQDDHVDVPTSIRALITRRIDRLPVPQQLTAKTASVVGPAFREPTVVGVYPNQRHRPHVIDHLHEFSQQQLIRLEREKPDRSYIFNHVTTQQVTYDQIPRANRIQLHQAIAAWYDAHEGGSPANFARLAYHYGSGELVEKEVEYLAKAGEHALRGFANREAERAFRAAIERSDGLKWDLDEPDVRRQLGHWNRQLGEALFQLGDIPGAEHYLYRAVELFGGDALATSVSKQMRLLGETARQVLHRLFPHIMISRQVVPKDAEHEGGRHEVALALQRLSELHYLKVDIVEGLGTAVRALNVAESAGRSALLARAYAGMTVVCGLIRRRRMAEHYAKLAEKVARQVNDQPTTAYVLMAVSVNRLGTAKWDLVEQHAAESVRIAEELQDNQQLALSLTLQAMLHCFRGNYYAAGPIEDRLRDAALVSGNDVHLAWSHSGRGECLFRCGDTRRAIDELQEAEQLLAGSQHDTEEIRVAGLLAIAHWRCGNRAEAGEAVRKTLDRIDKCSYATVSMLEAFSGIAEVVLHERMEQGADGPLQALLAEIMIKLRWYAKVFPIGRPRWLCHRGTCHWLHGRPRKARRDWARSLREATAMSLPLDMGLVHYQIGVHLETDSASRVKHLSLALEIFEELGVTDELNLAKLALADA